MIWDFLASYRAGVVVALLGVLVAAVYAFLTWRLAQTAKLQAEASAQQARAAADQARIARQVFEAAHRPYLEAAVTSLSSFTSPELFQISVIVKNYGPVPATLHTWQVLIRRQGQVLAETHLLPPEIGRCIFPGRDATLAFNRLPPGSFGVEPAGPTELDVSIQYRGSHGARYTTHIVATKEPGRVWEYTTEEIQ